ncbi:MAG TPA: VPLPA-CTERM sorting domain-containing protein [Candidatus Methylomirabilis sp.]|nr:VPLPA-CTERM sorting domain-containing protein [Candidatus Methylomirabilis sp.]
MKPTMNLAIIASSVVAALATANAQATLVNTGFVAPNPPGCGTVETGLCLPLSTDSANLTMLNAQGYMVGGTNDVHMTWDGNAYTSSSDYTGPGGASNVTLSSTSVFFGYHWTAHDVQMFMPGSYSFDVTLGGGNSESGLLNATVPSGELGMHMLVDWNINFNLDVFVVLSQNSVFGSGIANSANPDCGYLNGVDPTVPNCLWDGPNYGSAGKPAGNKVWGLASVDGNGDGVMGIPMAVNGPFAGFNANFSAYAPVPVPAATWLFGSGLVGLFGVARRRRVA